PSQFPLMVGWMNLTHMDLRNRLFFPSMAFCLNKLQEITEEDVDWCPYERADLKGLLPDQFHHQTWMVYAKVYSICFEHIARHPVNICWKQLGLQQEHLKKGLGKFRIPNLQQRGPAKNKDWRNANKFYEHCNNRWAKRNEFLIKQGLFYDGLLLNYEQRVESDEDETGEGQHIHDNEHVQDHNLDQYHNDVDHNFDHNDATNFGSAHQSPTLALTTNPEAQTPIISTPSGKSPTLALTTNPEAEASYYQTPIISTPSGKSPTLALTTNPEAEASDYQTPIISTPSVASTGRNNTFDNIYNNQEMSYKNEKKLSQISREKKP
ncbi:hypothetical protein KIW84_058037, partial [Lathyrus oleraceus]